MNGLVVKNVDFLGDSLMAAQDNDGNIWAGVSCFCRGIGLSKSQKDTQIQTIQSDETLKRGCLKFQAGVFDPNNETIALRLDFIPIWLAKLPITPAIKKSNPDLADRLLNYQLKAKDVLAAAFLPQTKPKTQAEVILEQAQLLVEQDKRLTTLEENSSRQERKLEELEAQMTTHPVDYYTIAGYANLKGVRLDVTRANMLGRKAAKLSREYGYDVGKTQDARFGTVNTYHVDILSTVFKGQLN